MNDILLILGGLVAGFLIWGAKTLIMKVGKKEVKTILTPENKAKLLELYNTGILSKNDLLKKGIDTTGKVLEQFDKDKLLGGLLNLQDNVKWSKTVSQELSIRTWLVRLTIIGIIIGVIYGFGWYKGRMGAPVHFDMRGKEATIQLNEHFLKIEKDGTANVVDKDGKVLKVIRVKDIPSLRRALRPYGLDMRAFVTAGGSLGQSGAKAEAGVGMQWFKWYQWYLNSFLTNVGIYPVGVSYKLTDNFDIIAGAGIGYKEFDKRVYIGGKWRF